MRRPVDTGDPDRLYTVTQGRSHPVDDSSFDLVTLVVSECGPTPGMQSEHVRILELCRHPTAVVEISAEMRLPITVVRILLGDLLSTGRITARHPRAGRSLVDLPDPSFLEEVLHGLRNL
ncbi:CvhC [Streptomyces clavuligerus]|nr:CvhC [Streptomyces clavuligerus]